LKVIDDFRSKNFFHTDIQLVEPPKSLLL